MKGMGRPNIPKIRRDWGNIKPWTKIKNSEKIYDRRKVKDELKRVLHDSTPDGQGEGLLGGRGEKEYF